MIFERKNLDYSISPYTGLTRASWIEAGEYLLKGIFQNIKSFDDPIVMPRKEKTVTYPHSEDALWEKKSEYFEGLARSLFIAAPLIKINPELTICGYKLKDYYKNQIIHACTKGDALSVGFYEELQKITDDYHRPFQQTVETCALVICLWISYDEIWNTYTKIEKDTIANFLMGYANGNTVPQNWRLFNMLDLAFLHREGYEIDKEIMKCHAQSILSYYAGDGWYRDGHSFDYYSCWAFNVYGLIWNEWYGYENEPYLAHQFAANSNKLMETYADFFDRDGFTNMWGRSNIYRNATTTPLSENMFINNSKMNPGLARRICSGSLLQFITRKDFLYKGVPTLGFYGEFTPLVQGYSCTESPFWLGKAFLCLYLPESHPFWTMKENNGTWEKLKEKEVKITTLDAPALCFSNHEANGETILRTGKVVKRCNDNHGMWNYSKLCFNTKYPWESTPTGNETEAYMTGKVESQQYVLEDFVNGEIQKCNVTFWSGERNDVLYRRQFFNYDFQKDSHWLHAMNLADFTVPFGIMRVDKMRLFRYTAQITLGSYGFPDNGTEIIKLSKDNAKAIILKGHDATGQEKQLAMTVMDGWDDISLIHSEGSNPDSLKSIVVYGKLSRNKTYGYRPFILISQVLTKESLTDFSEDEIFPIKEIVYEDSSKCGGYGNISVKFKNGSSKIISFDTLEGKLEL